MSRYIIVLCVWLAHGKLGMRAKRLRSKSNSDKSDLSGRGQHRLCPSVDYRYRERAELKEVYEQDPVRFEFMRHFGAFVTERSGHFSGYVPYFRKRPELIEQYCRVGYLGGTGFSANNWPTWRADNEKQIAEMLDGSRGSAEA